MNYPAPGSGVSVRGGKMRLMGGAPLVARYAGDDMSDGPMMFTPILIASSRRAFS